MKIAELRKNSLKNSYQDFWSQIKSIAAIYADLPDRMACCWSQNKSCVYSLMVDIPNRLNSKLKISKYVSFLWGKFK